MKWLFMRHAPLIIQPLPDLAKLSWVTRMLMNCTSAAYEVNKSRMVRLAEYSRDCLMQLRADTAGPYGRMVQLIGMAQTVGLSRIGFVADPVTGAPATAAPSASCRCTR